MNSTKQNSSSTAVLHELVLNPVLPTSLTSPPSTNAPINKRNATVVKPGPSRLHIIATWLLKLPGRLIRWLSKGCIPKKPEVNEFDNSKNTTTQTSDTTIFRPTNTTPKQAQTIPTNEKTITPPEETITPPTNFDQKSSSTLERRRASDLVASPLVVASPPVASQNFTNKPPQRFFINNNHFDAPIEHIPTVPHIDPQPNYYVAPGFVTPEIVSHQPTDEEIIKNEEFQEFKVKINTVLRKIEVKDEIAKAQLNQHFGGLRSFQNLRDLWLEYQREENPNAALDGALELLEWKVSQFSEIANQRHEVLSTLNAIRSEFSKNKSFWNSTQNSGQKIESVLKTLSRMVKVNNLPHILQRYGDCTEGLDAEFRDAKSSLEVYEYDLKSVEKYSTQKIRNHQSLVRKNKINQALAQEFEDIYDAYSKVDLTTALKEETLVITAPSLSEEFLTAEGGQ